MGDFSALLIRWCARIVLLLAAFLCLVFVLAVSVLLALVWTLHALWAGLTGKPVRAWGGYTRNRWQTVYRSGAQWMAQKSAGDITDVQPREIREH